MEIGFQEKSVKISPFNDSTIVYAALGYKGDIDTKSST